MLVSLILAKLQRALEARKAVRLLASYSDRELADLGLTRDQIDAAVRGSLGPGTSMTR